MGWPTFLRSPLRRVLRRVSVDAPIDSTIDFASSFPPGEEALQLLGDARDERSKLRAVLNSLDHLLVDAERKGHRQPVARWLGRVRDAIWDAEDVLDEFATDAALLHRQWEKLSAGQQPGASESEVWDAFSEKLKSYQLDGVRRRLEVLVEEGRLELGLEEEEELADDPAESQQEHYRPAADADQIRASYEQLAPSVKECFAYCSLLPRDLLPGLTGYNKNDIVQLWISQGFLDRDDDEEALPMVRWGERHLQKLVSLSLLDCTSSLQDDEVLYSQSATFTSQGQGSESEPSYYALSDPARDLALSVCRDYCVVEEDDQEQELGEIPAPDRVRHLSRVEYSSDLASIPAHVLCRYEKLRSFFLSDPRCVLLWAKEEFARFLEEVAFAKFGRLRTLRLNGVQLPELPASIRNLKLLRLLDLTAAPIEALPESVGELYNLQVLELGACINLRELPEGLFCNLTSLRWLGVCMTPLRELPESLGCARNLQMLDATSCDELEKLPESLGNLTELVALHAPGTSIKRVPDGVGNLRNLRTLLLPASFEELPESLGELSNLEVLAVRGGSRVLKKLPESLRKLTSLTHLNLASSGLRHLPGESLYNLPSLKEINLTELDLEDPQDAEVVRRLVNEKGVVLWYCGRHTSIPEAEETNQDQGEDY